MNKRYYWLKNNVSFDNNRYRKKPNLELKFNGQTIEFKGCGKIYDYECSRISGHRKHKNELLRKYKKCVYCGSSKDLEIDHYIPKSHGGSDNIDNLVISCSRCNKYKSSRTVEKLNLQFIFVF